MLYKILYINIDTQRAVTSAGNQLASKPVLSWGEQPVYRITLGYVTANAATGVTTLEGADVSAVAGWRVSVDSDLSQSTPPMCRTTTEDGIDASGAADGVILVPIDTNTDRFAAVVDGKANVSAYMQIRGYDIDGRLIVDLRIDISAWGCVDYDGTGEVIPDDIINGTALRAILLGMVGAGRKAFATTAETGETVTLTPSDLGLSTGVQCAYSIWTDAMLDVSGDARISRQWVDGNLVLTFDGGWPAGSWLAVPDGVMGPAGRNILYMAPLYQDSELGRSCHLLYDSADTVTSIEYMDDITSITLKTRATDSDATGDAVINVLVNGTLSQTLTIPATADLTDLTIRFGEAISGVIALERDLADDGDTLDPSVALALYGLRYS